MLYVDDRGVTINEEEDKLPKMILKAAVAEFAQCRQQQLVLLENAAWQKTAIHMEQLWLTRDEFLE